MRGEGSLDLLQRHIVTQVVPETGLGLSPQTKTELGIAVFSFVATTKPTGFADFHAAGSGVSCQAKRQFSGRLAGSSELTRFYMRV